MKQPAYKLAAFVCPNCMAYAKQDWYTMDFQTVQNYMTQQSHNIFLKGQLPDDEMDEGDSKIAFAECSSCEQISFWLNQEMKYPLISNIEMPKDLMPSKVKALYEEARQVFPVSPRSSAALLRLALEVLLPHLGARKGKLNTMIGQLVEERKVFKRVQEAMDYLRVTGNEAVHPGVLDKEDRDDSEVSLGLFKIINYIVAETIESDAMVEELYQILPDPIKKGIENRDKDKRIEN
ncbi:DUF4145 domain-containing protein [Exiguobacterium sp. s142]|uniref:DUF4145 domain-containing protein n=1 Tax=Exiguobacterium sp. s142 TaxID=2751222 RepID=UPI001BEAA9B3|nr:DUF4145 domain-containing protein [Exiguobacterium sp. s142]